MPDSVVLIAAVALFFWLWHMYWKITGKEK